jgi:hypothetical protein
VTDLLDTTIRTVNQLLMNMQNGRVEIEGAEARSAYLQRRIHEIIDSREERV